VTVVAQWATAPGILLCCGFDSYCLTQILYKENRKMLFGAQKKQKEKEKKKLTVDMDVVVHPCEQWQKYG
jgi:hypothetical protein